MPVKILEEIDARLIQIWLSHDDLALFFKIGIIVDEHQSRCNSFVSHIERRNVVCSENNLSPPSFKVPEEEYSDMKY